MALTFTRNEIVLGKTWPALLRKVRSLARRGWIFRALDPSKPKAKQTRQTASIASSFDKAWDARSRMRPAKKEPRTPYESRMLYEFKRECPNHLQQLPARTDFLEWLALGRHYGMPSRLVDFTYSFYVAAYLALSERIGNDNARILALDLKWMKDDVERKLRTEWRSKLDDLHVLNDEASFQNPTLFKAFAFHWRENYVVPVNPSRRNPRLASQHGLFLCPGNIEETFEKNLKDTLGKTGKVKKLIYLPPGVRAEAMRDLRQMNVSASTLFPGLEGWAQSQRDLVHLDISDERLKKVLKQALDKPLI